MAASNNGIPAEGWIRAARDAGRISSYQLAERAGVAQPTVMNWEKRERSGAITLASLRRAAEALDCALVYTFQPRERAGMRGVGGPPRRRPPRRPPPPRVQSMDPNSIWGG